MLRAVLDNLLAAICSSLFPGAEAQRRAALVPVRVRSRRSR
jgi:hypothetical protein